MIDGLCATLLPCLLLLVRHALLLDTGLLALVADPDVTDRARLRSPPVLEVALRAWGGERPTSTLGTALIFQCRQPTIMRAIAGSELFRPYIQEVLGTTAVVVDAGHAQAFRERLAWVGLEVTEDGSLGQMSARTAGRPSD